MNKEPKYKSQTTKEIEWLQDRKNNHIRNFREETEFNILIGQSANLAQADNEPEIIEERFEFWFDFILRKRTDPKFIKKFNDYLWIKNNKEEVAKDRMDEQLNDAEHDANANYIDEVKPEEL